MAKEKTFAEMLERNKNKGTTSAKSEVPLPVKSGRQTIPEGNATIGGILSEMASINPDFNIQILDALENLAKYHPEVSQAVENIVNLGNTVKTFPVVTFDSKVSDKQQKEMLLHLKKQAKNWYAYSGGIPALVGDLLSQSAITGAVSAEIVPNKQLNGVKKIVTVSPKTIRFQYNIKKDSYDPLQVHTNSSTSTIATAGVVLNTNTYAYIALRRHGEKPYAIPPFLAALESIPIGKDMTTSLKAIVKKIGVLGFLEALVDVPKPIQGETETAFATRTGKHLSEVATEVDKGLAKGFVVGFKGQHEFNMHNTSGNVEGAAKLMEVNDVNTMTGLKQDPMMFGRNFSTTETLARVILAKMSTQITTYQQSITTFLEKAFLLELRLSGYKIDDLTVTLDAPMISDKKRDIETRKLEIENQDLLYQQGIVSQEQRAVALGYEQPAEEEPRAKTEASNIVDGEPAKGDTTATDTKKNSSSVNLAVSVSELTGVYKNRLMGQYAEYPYDMHSDCSCGNHGVEQFATEVPKDLNTVEEFTAAYYQGTKANFDKATAKVANKIANNLATLTQGATEQQVTDLIIATLYKEWGTVFSVPQKAIINKFVKAAYPTFRKDKTVLKGVDNIPEGTFGRVDLRLMDYYKKSDELYLGKFITDDDLKKNISAYVREEFQAGNNLLSDEAIENFKLRFGDIMEGQDYKLRRILSTTVNKMRNSAATSYMQQAGVDTYEIRGVTDRLQCPYCTELQGTRFNVDRAMKTISNYSSSTPEIIAVDTPFVTSVFKNASEVEGLNGEELHDLGIFQPPFHPQCRDQVVAIL